MPPPLVRSIRVTLSPATHALLAALARQHGLAPAAVLTELIEAAAYRAGFLPAAAEAERRQKALVALL